MSSDERIRKEVDEYYTGKVLAHGATPQGVDWNGKDSQHLRFKTLLNIVDDPTAAFSLLDFGCGYGSLYEFMQPRFKSFRYTGYDISEAMIAEAQKLYPMGTVEWSTQRGDTSYDYIVASGIFNVRLQTDEAAWWKYICDELDWMNTHATKGFSFNMLTSYSDAERMRDYLYYANPTAVFDRCKTKYSKFVALLHDYPLYEFTILVRKA
jgi:SAM-dependent methyltransferase